MHDDIREGMRRYATRHCPAANQSAYACRMKIETIAHSWRPLVQFRAPSGATVEVSLQPSNPRDVSCFGWLTRTTTRHALAAAAFLLPVAPTAIAQASPADLARKNGCMSCHGLLHRQVGPGFAQISDRYRRDAEAPARLTGKIRNGSVGAWGRVIMPRQAHVSESDARALAGWVLSQPPPDAGSR